MSEQCSELFEKAFDSHVGGLVRECVCGITYFDGYNDCDWETGELEGLRAKAKEQPEKFVEHNCAIGTMNIGGGEIVFGCTCDIAARYEHFIIDHARQLARYLRERSAQLISTAKDILPDEPKGEA